jgi:hypothetical protein
MKLLRRLRSGLLVSSCGLAIYACGSTEESTFPTSGSDDTSFGGDGSPGFDDSGASGKDGGPISCVGGCPGGLVCVVDRCLPPQPPCNNSNDCKFDTYCARLPDGTGMCVPFGSAPDNKTSDPSCNQLVAAGAFSPKIKCEFKPPAGDAFPYHIDVQATPMVVNFNQSPTGVTGPPSVIVGFTPPANDPASPFNIGASYTETKGVVRVLKGTDCSLEANLGGIDIDGDAVIDWTYSSSPVAVGDLDGDKVAEIVVFMADLTTVAFTRKGGSWAPLWPLKKATLADGVTIFTGLASSWAGPSIHDLDDDGKPEIIREGTVIDGLTGKVIVGEPAGYATYSNGIPPVLANLDADPRVELTNGAHIWEFDPVAKAWVVDPTYEAASSPPGWVAVADFTPYDGLKKPELVVASTDKLTVYSLDHSIFRTMQNDVPGTGGGPPTVADYDGDGLPEIGLAGRDYYTVFDPDCQGTPRPGGLCADRTHCDFAAGGACPDNILWSHKTQDFSSNITGSSVFDFEADGKAEVVYADECFTRVYSGLDGKVLFSQYRSSCTWLENPVIADVDGDFRAELVVPSNTACGPVGTGLACSGLDANGVDSQFTGLVCQKSSECLSGACDAGYCRCTSSAQCCTANADAACIDFGFQCAPPPAGTPGAGNTCRASHPKGLQGIRIYEDSADRWVRSRSIWNQHAYAVTHVNDDGTIPKTSQWANNWTDPTLNNFRQNVPGVSNGAALGDFTAPAALTYTCGAARAATLSMLVCNRGAAPVASGVPVGFYAGSPLAKVCSTTTNAALDPGQCQSVSCVWANPPPGSGGAVAVTVVPNDGATTAECNPGNNNGLILNVYCEAPK